MLIVKSGPWLCFFKSAFYSEFSIAKHGKIVVCVKRRSNHRCISAATVCTRLQTVAMFSLFKVLSSLAEMSICVFVCAPVHTVMTEYMRKPCF